MNATATWRSGAATDIGRQRTINEDRVYADDAEGVFLVIDGLGGHAAGEKAAETALQVIVRELGSGDEDIRAQVRRAITHANNEIFRLAGELQDCSGMACVLTLAVVRRDVLTIGHVGDSRLYLIWNGTARKITSDHSPVGEQEDQGELTEAEAMSHPRRNEVFRDVGTRLRSTDDIDFIEIRSFPLHPAAAFLLCSDGLSDALKSSEIAATVETYDGDPNRVARALIDAANKSDGSDNVSVVFVAGPDFIGIHSPAIVSARARHAITRVQRRRAAWRRRIGRVVWILIGIILGMLAWPFAVQPLIVWIKNVYP